MAQARVGVDERRHRGLLHDAGMRFEIELALRLGALVVHEHRDAVGVDAGEVRLDHHLGGGAHELRVHAPGPEDGDDLLAHALCGAELLRAHSSTRMPAALITSAHCADSARIAAPNSSAELPTTSAPRSAIFFCSSSCLRIFKTSPFS